MSGEKRQMISGASIRAAFVHAGILPTNVDGLDREFSGDENLLPLIVEAWQQCDHKSQHRGNPRNTVFLNWLACQQQLGAQLRLGIPSSNRGGLESWLGTRAVWCPRSIPWKHCVGLVSSRLGRRPDPRRSWFQHLRSACANLQCDTHTLIVASSTATDRLIGRAACLFELPVLRIHLPKKPGIKEWLQDLRAMQNGVGQDHVDNLFLSPPLEPTDQWHDNDLITTPAADRAAVALSDTLFVVHMRRKGNLHRLVCSRLANDCWLAGSVYVALHDELVDQDLAGELLSAGAVGWYLSNSIGNAKKTTAESLTESSVPTTIFSRRAENERAETAIDRPASSDASFAPSNFQTLTRQIVGMPNSENWAYLTHCTRGQARPWPNQDDDEYLDDLILDRKRSKHSPLSALMRIVRMKRICASSRAIRGGFSMVCFTAIPLPNLCKLRRYQRHRGQWDFEPYGICVQREWLQKFGALPVRYGDDALWSQLTEAERPFFQLRGLQRGAKTLGREWETEQEWRVKGDVELHHLADDHAFLFVPNELEAHKLSRISRWPVTITPSPY